MSQSLRAMPNKRNVSIKRRDEQNIWVENVGGIKLVQDAVENVIHGFEAAGADTMVLDDLVSRCIILKHTMHQ